MGEVVECLLRRLGITHLRTSAYHPQTDANGEGVHFSVHNIITKLIDDKHERWPDLLGTVVLAYNATVHTATGYSPHELFCSFAPSCPLDVMVSIPASDPVSNADKYALQAFKRLQEATAFVREHTGKQMQRMKRYYDSSVKPQGYAVGEKVPVYNPRKQKVKFAKWQVCWKGPVTVEHKLNDTNYVLHKGRGKAMVVHIDGCKNCLNCRILNQLIRTRTLSAQNPQFSHASSGVGQQMLQTVRQTCTVQTLQIVQTGQIGFCH